MEINGKKKIKLFYKSDSDVSPLVEDVSKGKQKVRITYIYSSPHK